MFTCPNCGKELEDGTKFCAACGKRVYEPIFCPYCGEKTTTEFEVCPKCGAIFTEIDEDTAAPNESMVAVENRVAARKAPKLVVPKAVKAPENAAAKALPKKGILIAGIIVAVLAVIAVIGFIIFGLLGGRGSDYYGLYIKDNEIYYTDYSGKYTIQVTSRLLNGDEFNFADADDADDAAEAIGDVIAFSDDGKRIFYPDRAEMGENIKTSEISLYYRDINKPEKEAVKVDSGIKNYAINSAGSQVVYLKNDNLYVYDIKKGEKEKIASDVIVYKVADDCKKIGYVTDDKYYLWQAGKGSEKWASNILSWDLMYATSDLSMIYYIGDDVSLYKRTAESEDREKISSYVTRIICAYDSGEIYYLSEPQMTMMDYVDDDLAASDAAVTKPTYPSDTIWTNMLQYNVNYAIYREKLNRDELRSQLQNTRADALCSIYYYDGEKETLLTDKSVQEHVYTQADASGSPAVMFRRLQADKDEKIEMSSISSLVDVENFIDDLFDSYNFCFSAYANVYDIGENTSANYLWLAHDGQTLYYLDNPNYYSFQDVNGQEWFSSIEMGNLYRIKIDDGQFNTSEFIDEEAVMTGAFTENDHFIYSKNFVLSHDNEEPFSDLYVDGILIDYDVDYVWDMVLDDGTVLYYTDWDAEKQYGTLNSNKDGTKTKVGDDIHRYGVTSKDDILYLYDYSTRSFNGTLYLYNNGKPKKIDSDVVAIIPTDSSTSNTLRGKNYDDYKWYW